MKYIYGPVKSRRIGLSLGVSLTPLKTCSFDCVYCQLGLTTVLVSERCSYLPTEVVIEELKLWLEGNKEQAASLDYITLSGFGEPTLNLELDSFINKIKALTAVPVAVITNSSTIFDPAVRHALARVSLVVPSLDAASDEIFARIDRPHPNIKIQQVVDGLVSLRREFSGKIWLEVMVVKGLNDDLRHIKKLKIAIDKINPDKIQLNSPVRNTACEDVLPVTEKKLKKIKEILGDKCDIV
jgi:wyosine [tRNA(Phe)-imidazoG37] synthetase (radical SAM superfamily)